MKRLMVVALATTLAITGCSSSGTHSKKFKRARGADSPRGKAHGDPQ